MSFLRLAFLFLGLSQVRGCVTPICDAIHAAWPPEAVVTRTGDQRLLHAAKLAGGDLLVETGVGFLPPEYHHTLVRMDPATGPEELAKFKLMNYFGSNVIAAGDTWWYSIGGGRTPDEHGVFFVTPERQQFVPTTAVAAADWLPFHSPEPGGLMLAGTRGGRVALEITPAGIKRSWRMPQHNSFSNGWHSAEQLPDGTVALVLYQPASGLELYRFGAGEPEIVQLRRGVDVRRLATVLAGESLAIVTESRTGELEAAVVDPRQPADPQWLALNAKDDRGGAPALVAYRDGFVVAWKSSEDLELRARTFTAGKLGPAGVIATMQLREKSFTNLVVIPDGDELLFLWPEDDPMLRRVPAEFAGLSFAERLCRWLFDGTSVAL